jgi:NADPH:quinone reductase-like Zn-dependent oxidoreductase
MKAIVQSKFGLPHDVLELKDIDRPPIKDNEVLVRVHAASIHIGDWHVLRGAPSIMRPIFRALRPKHGVPGTDFAGTAEAVGDNVTRLTPGVEVFGAGKGAFAEYAVAKADNLVAKPANLSFEQAATVATSALTALQALRDRGNLQAGQKVLITGASGGVGTFAVQIAKSLGAEVTGVCSTRNLDMVRSIGADHVIDYTQEDYTRGNERYDLILDNIGNHSLADTRRPLTPNGTLLANGAPVGGWVGGLGRPLKALVSSLFVRRQGGPFVSTPKQEDFIALKELAEAGKLTPVIDKTFSLGETAAAIAHVGAGHSQGKTVITV